MVQLFMATSKSTGVDTLIDDVKHKDSFTCMDCKTPVVAKKGSKKAHHFAHRLVVELTCLVQRAARKARLWAVTSGYWPFKAQRVRVETESTVSYLYELYFHSHSPP